MTLKTRKILFLICLFIFIASAPILVGYALGYRYNLENNRLIKTGAFLIKTQPSETNIYLDGLLQDNKMMITPKGLIDKFIIITGLEPKNYSLEVKLENYHSWKKNLKIKEGLVTKVNNIILLSKNPEIFSLNNEEEKEAIENFFTSNNNPGQINYQEKIISEIISNQFFTYTIFQNSIYYLEKPTAIIYKTDLKGKSKKQINLTNLESENLSEKTKLIISDEEKIAVLNNNSLYLLNQNNQLILISGNVKGAEFFPNSSNLLWFTPSEIYVWQQNIQSENEGESRLITRYGKQIKKAVWAGDSNHIFFIVDKKIKFIETDDRDQRNVFDFIELKNEDGDLFYDSKNKKLYFLDEKIYWVDL
jgi:hypothetical protein